MVIWPYTRYLVRFWTGALRRMSSSSSELWFMVKKVVSFNLNTVNYRSFAVAKLVLLYKKYKNTSVCTYYSSLGYLVKSIYKRTSRLEFELSQDYTYDSRAYSTCHIRTLECGSRPTHIPIHITLMPICAVLSDCLTD